MKPRIVKLLLSGVMAISCISLAYALETINNPSHQPTMNYDLRPTGKGNGDLNAKPLKRVEIKVKNAASPTTIPQQGIYYHGGPVMATTLSTIPTVYLIFYGDWSYDPDAASIITTFLSGLGGSPYFNINTSYTNGSGAPVINKLNLNRKIVYDNYSQGASLTDQSVENVVSGAINSKKLPLDPNGIYVVAASKDVDETSGLCTLYCAWHTYDIISNTSIKFAFAGDPARCPTACSAQPVTPNNNLSADAIVNTMAHEIEESVTDPELNAWYDKKGQENADKCAWTFGSIATAGQTPNGAYYNMVINGLPFLIQQNFVNAKGTSPSTNGYCALSY